MSFVEFIDIFNNRVDYMSLFLFHLYEKIYLKAVEPKSFLEKREYNYVAARSIVVIKIGLVKLRYGSTYLFSHIQLTDLQTDLYLMDKCC